MVWLLEPLILSRGAMDGSSRIPGGVIVPPRSAQADPFAATGWTVWTFLLATLLALPASWGLLSFYRRTVVKSMRRRVDGRRSEAQTVETRTQHQATPPAISFRGQVPSTLHSAEAGDLLSDLRFSPWMTAGVYAAAGLTFGLATAFFVLIAGSLQVSSTRLLVLTWLYVWPAAVAVYLVAGSARYSKLAIISTYFAIYLMICVIATAVSPNLRFAQPLILWMIENLLPTILSVIFINRRVRAVGPLILLFMIISVIGALATPFILFSSHTPGLTLLIAGLMGGGISFVAAQVLGFAVFGATGWFALQYVRKLYEAKKFSDQEILLGVIWLQFAVFWYVNLAFAGYAWLLSVIPASILFVLTLRAGFALRSRALPPGRGRQLLVLRVFALGPRSERLFEVVANHWRHVGSIAQIAGPDLVKATVQPHEFLDFMSGKLPRRFIDGSDSLNRRLSEADQVRDADGRFRVNDFFCFDDTWKMVLSSLIRDADGVLMDLRGFSPQNSGCVFEIEHLINVFPIGHAVFIVDDTTDEPFLNATLQQAAQHTLEGSPNKEKVEIHAVRFGGVAGSDLQNLFAALSDAATGA